jgi:Gpi18-like mannosyltransferase
MRECGISLGTLAREYRGVALVCAGLLAVKLISIALFFYTYDDFTAWISETQGNNAAQIFSFRALHSNSVFEVLGYRFDSVSYVTIAREGYADARYLAFPPGYPLLIRLASWTGVGEVAGGVLVANVFQMVAVFLLYVLALRYLGRSAALLAAALFAFFPYNLLSGTMAYSDAIFTSFSIASWLLFERKSYGWCGVMVLLASLMRFQGVLLYPLYSVILVWRDRKILSLGYVKSLLSLNVSAVFILYWILFFIPSSGMSYNNIQELYWEGGFKYPLASLIYIVNNLPVTFHNIPFIVFIVVAGALSYKLAPELGFYSLVFIAFYFSFSGVKAYSISRYLGTIWPAFLYAGWKLNRILNNERLQVYAWDILAVFVVMGVCALLVQMNSMLVS